MKIVIATAQALHDLSWWISFNKKAKKNNWSTHRNDNRVKKVTLEKSAIDHWDIFFSNLY